MKIIKLFIVSLSTILLCNSYLKAEESYFKTVTIDAVKNCTSTSGKKGAKNFEARVKKLELTPGEYHFECISGGISKWPDKATAHSQNREPWLCFAKISVDGEVNTIGRDWGYTDKETAIEANKENIVELNITKQTLVYLWIEDTWDGVDYCNDNRGTLTIGIRKIK